MNPTKYFRADRSTAFLVISNLLTIALALVLRWEIQDVMWVYWGQSVIIGIYHWRRMLNLGQSSTQNPSASSPPPQTQGCLPWFFLVHYGFFHFVYLMFLVGMTNSISGTSVLGIAFCLLTFVVNHGFSYWQNKQRDLDKPQDFRRIMFFPYARIVPMHFTIIFGSAIGVDSGGALVLFLLSKTVADVIMHTVERADRGNTPFPPSDVLAATDQESKRLP